MEDEEDIESVIQTDEKPEPFPEEMFAGDAANPVQVVPRSEWGADPPLSKEFLCTPVEKVILFHTETETCYTPDRCKKAVKELQKFYVQKKGLPDIPWNFLVGGDGMVYEGRGWTTNATKLHPKYDKDNGKTLDVAYIGTFNDKMPEKVFTLAANNLFTLAMEKCVLDMAFEMGSDLMDDFVEKPK